jgi:hypothetical protein
MSATKATDWYNAHHRPKIRIKVPVFPPSAVRTLSGEQPNSYTLPRPIRHASGHGRGHAKCTMNFDEVVGEIVEPDQFKVAHYLFIQASP